MRVSEVRCTGSVLLEMRGRSWFDGNGLRPSKTRQKLMIGTCLHCGKRHYDVIPKV